ncbi:MAG: IclR family transcriptional regulator [Acidobacteriota bacterium]|nr:IclR family transcriptional regulator [Acidobacteriota bacterium]
MKPNTELHGEYQVQALDRTFAILDVLARSNQLLGPTELGKRLNLHRSTVHRLLAVLERHRYVERDTQTAKYRLGLKLVELSSFALPQFEFERSAKPYVEKLAAETGEAAHMGILCSGEVMSILHAAGSNEANSPSTVGRRSPIHCTSLGKAILAFRKEANELILSHRFVMHTKKTITNSAQFSAELDKVRVRGIAIDDEEFQEGLRCIGAPVCDRAGRAIAAISIAGPRSRISNDRSIELARAVLAISRALSEAVAKTGEGVGDRFEISRTGV